MMKAIASWKGSCAPNIEDVSTQHNNKFQWNDVVNLNESDNIIIICSFAEFLYVILNWNTASHILLSNGPAFRSNIPIWLAQLISYQ